MASLRSARTVAEAPIRDRPQGAVIEPDSIGLSDETLLAGLGSGDQVAARAFVDRFRSRVYGVAVRVVGDRELAEDVAQEAFLRAWRHAGAYDARRGTVVAWLLRITRNVGIDVLRLRRPTAMDPAVLANFDHAGPAVAVEDAVVASDLTAAVRDVLDRLPAEQSRALLLAAFYGHTASEISVSEGIPLGTAKTRIRLGLRKVRAQLASTDVTDENEHER